MWKLVHNNLINKSGLWISADNWSLPEEGSEGGANVVNSSKNLVLSIESDEIEPGLIVTEKVLIPNDARQIWVRSKANRPPYFTLFNPNSGKYLSANSNGVLTIEGTYKHFVCFFFWQMNSI